MRSTEACFLSPGDFEAAPKLAAGMQLSEDLRMEGGEPGSMDREGTPAARTSTPSVEGARSVFAVCDIMIFRNTNKKWSIFLEANLVGNRMFQLNAAYQHSLRQAGICKSPSSDR
jgi:hypothetical protein